MGETVKSYSPGGAMFEFTPALHVCRMPSASLFLTINLMQIKEDLDVLKSLDRLIKAGFVNGLPPHISDIENSCFCIMSEDEFEEKSVEEIQRIMKEKHILVTDLHSSVLKFDAKGLSSLASLSIVTDIQGMWNISTPTNDCSDLNH
jgi:hypothetical protein